MNPSKLLPSVSSFSAIIRSVRGGVTLSDKKTQVESKKGSKFQSSLRKELLTIRSKTITIEKLFQSSYAFKRKKFILERKEKEVNTRKEKEKKLESKKEKLGLIEFPSIARFGFFDAIKRFIFFTFLGIALPTLLKIVPKIIEFGTFLSPAIKFFGDVTKGLLNGLVTFIDFGYKIQDTTRSVAKQIGGEKAQKQFDGFVKNLNTFIDLSILAGLTALDVGLDAERFNRKLRGGDRQGRPGAERRGPVKPTIGMGGQSGLGRGMPVTTGRGGKPGLGRGAKVTIGGEGGKVPSWWNKFLKGPFAKLKGPLSKFAGAAVPGLGAAVGAADSAARFSAGDKVGGVLASVSAALDVATAAAALTGIGLPVAGILGTISMGIDVVLLIRDIIRTFFPTIPMFSSGGRIKLLAQGGRIGQGGRTIKVSRNSPKVTLKQNIKPGQDIGGKNQILKLFPDPSPENKTQTTAASPWWKQWLFGSTGQQNSSQSVKGKPANPFRALTSTAKTLSKIPGPFGLLMSAGTLIPLGQKPDRNLGSAVGNMIGGLTQDIIDSQVNLSFGDIMRFISGYASGGDLRSANIIRENNIGAKVGQLVGKSIDFMISSRVDEAVRGIFKEISMVGKPEDHLTQPPPGGDDEIPIDVDPSDVIGRVGSTGLSSGPHIHVEDYRTPGGSIPDNIKSSILVDGKPMTSGIKTSPVGWRTHPVLGTRKYHAGEDWAFDSGKPISLTGGLKFVKYVSEGSDSRFSGYGNVVVIQAPDGKKYFLGHLSSGPRNLQALQQRQQQQITQNLRPTGNVFTGSASWYGRKDGFQGKSTSNGEIFNTDKLTAAIQIGLRNQFGGVSAGKPVYYAKVTNTQNGKSVTVRINDVGPLVPGGVIDLSEAAFKKISSGGLGQGRIPNVKVEKLGSAPRTQASTSQPPVSLRQSEPPDAPIRTHSSRPSTLEQLRQQGIRLQSSSILPSSKTSQLAQGLNQTPSYDEGGSQIAIAPVIMEKVIPIPMSSGFSQLNINNTRTSFTRALA